MTKRSWLRSLFALPTVSPVRRLCVEALEGRLVPATFHVTSLLDDGSPGTLRDAINQANNTTGDNTIDIDVVGNILLQQGQLVNYGSLTIHGPGASALSIDGGSNGGIGGSRIFLNDHGSLSLDGLSIVHGFDGLHGPFGTGEGGGIENQQGNLVLTNCTISGCRAEGIGGGIDNAFGRLVATGCTFDSNTVFLDTPSFGGGAIFSSNGYLALSNCVLSNNFAPRGGAIRNARGPAIITGCTLINNSTQVKEPDYFSEGPFFGDGGGAIWNVNGPLTVIDSTLSGNSAIDEGGAIASYSNSAYSGAAYSPSTLEVIHCSFDGNHGAVKGGGIYNDGGSATLTDNQFVTCFAVNLGGGIDNARGVMSVTGCTFTDGGGGLGSGINNEAGVVSVDGCTFTDNQCAVGGAINNTGTMSVADSIITGNYASGGGGGIANSGCLVITGSAISENSCPSGYGGGILNYGGGSLTLTNSTLSGNLALQGGGTYNNATAALTNTTVSGNSSYFPGGGIANLGALTMNNSIVGGNTVDDSLVGDNPLNGSPADIDGTLDPSSSHNLIGPGGSGGLIDGVNGNIVVADAADLLLGPLADNGGPTWTLALLPGSPALNAGDNALAVDAQGNPLPTDQRGPDFPRIVGATVDIGAFEVQNQPPTVTCTLAAVTVNEGSSATNSGTFDDPQGPATVTLTASLGTMTRDDSTGTWSWSYTPADGPSGPTRVTITATNDGGLTATTTFTLTVNNVAPTASITGVPPSGHSPEGTVITLGSTVTDPSPVDTAAGFTYAWSVTKNGAGFASGTAASFSFTPDDNGTYVVTLTATDKDGGVSQPATANITVDNIAPTAGVSGPADGVRGQARTFTLTASDPSSVDQATGFTFTITWGDGATLTVTGPSGTAVSHVYTANGTYTVQVTAKDKDGGTSTAAKQADTIAPVALETDPIDPSKTALFVGGTTGADTITLQPAETNGTLNVKIGTASLGNFKPTGRIVVYGQAGDDTIVLANSLTVNASIIAGDGNDIVQAGGGNIIVTLGNGNDTVQLGNGANTVTLGNGNDTVQLGNGNNAVVTGNGNDTVQLGNGANVVVTGNGNDKLQAGNGNNLIAAGLGQHTVQVGNGHNILIDGSVALTGSGDSLRQVLNDWVASGAAAASGIRSRLAVTYNRSHANKLQVGSGLDWFWATYAGDSTNRKATDLLN